MLFKIPSQHKNKRLDKFLTLKLKNLSRSQIQKLIKQGNIQVNNKKAKSVHQFLKIGDKVQIKSTITDAKTKNELKPQFALKIIAEEPDFIIVSKPAGQVVHPDSKHKAGTLAQEIVKKYPKIAKIGENKLRPGIVHRLDKDVSGLLVIARTQEMFEHLKKQFKQRTVLKEYTALVHGAIKRSEGIIDFPIGRAKKGGKMKAVPKLSLHQGAKIHLQDNSRDAYTYFEVIKRYQHYTMLKIKIKTGRTHQIRVHLNAYGHHIIGDLIYRPKTLKFYQKNDRIMLEATKLGFRDLDGKKRVFQIKESHFLVIK